jgi:hypothetical protein
MDPQVLNRRGGGTEDSRGAGLDGHGALLALASGLPPSRLSSAPPSLLFLSGCLSELDPG